MDRCDSLSFCDTEFQIAPAFNNCVVKDTSQMIASSFTDLTRPQILSSDCQNHNHFSIEETSFTTT